MFCWNGAYCSVKLAKEITSKLHYAIKLIEKKRMEEYKAENNIIQEIKIHSKLSHPNIVQLYEYFEDEQYIYIVQEYCTNGTLREQIQKKKLKENEIFQFCYQINEALMYLHQQKIIHRDIKLENILLDQNNNIKITDFNWAIQLKGQCAQPIYCGTTEYMPPEIILMQYHTEKVDIWSFGVVLFELIYKKRPFTGLTQEELQNNILQLNPLTDKIDLPTDLMMLLFSLLSKFPQQRINCHQIKSSQWFQRLFYNSFLKSDDSIDNSISNLTEITYNKTYN